jgi:hypothetical protein
VLASMSESNPSLNCREYDSKHAKLGFSLFISCSKAERQSQRFGTESELNGGLVERLPQPVLEGISVTKILRIMLKRRCPGINYLHYLRPVPGHAGRVKWDITSAPNQAACLVSKALS